MMNPSRGSLDNNNNKLLVQEKSPANSEQFSIVFGVDSDGRYQSLWGVSPKGPSGHSII